MEVAGKKLETKEGHLSLKKSFCEPCQGENVNTIATGYCKECEECMCDTCFHHHIKAKLCRNHVLVSTGELPKVMRNSTEEKCEKHDNEVIKFYCRTHETVGCGDCMIFDHLNCKPEYIKDLAPTFNEDINFKQMLETLEMKESFKTESIAKLEENERRIEQLNEKALEAITQFRSDIDKFLDKAEADIKSEVKRTTAKNIERHQKLNQDVGLLMEEFEDTKKELNLQGASKTASFIHAVRCKQHKDNIEKVMERVKHQHGMDKFEFVRSEKITEMLKAEFPFGRLQTNNDDLVKVTEFVKNRTSNPPQELTSSHFVEGARVRRGPDWKYKNEDDGGQGTVISLCSPGWVKVRWDTGRRSAYRIGYKNAFDLIIV